MAQFFIDHVKRNEERVYVSSGVGPDEIDSENGEEQRNSSGLAGEQIELIHPNHVLKALRIFLEHHRAQHKETSQAAYRVASLDDRDDSLDAEYWSKYPNLIDEKRERLWKALLSGLQKYHSTLAARAKLLDENLALAKQNDELRLLLSKYMQSKVNQELQIPPSQIIQLQLSEQSSGNGPAVY